MWRTLMLAALFVALAAPGCKKKSEAAADLTPQADAAAPDAAGQAAAEKKPKKKRKKPGKKPRKKPRKKPGAVEEAPPSQVEAPAPPSAPEAPEEPVAAPREPLGDAPATPPPPEAGREAPRLPREEPRPDAAKRALAGAIHAPPVQVSVARLLTVADLNRLLPEKGWIGHGPVQGIPPNEYFNSLLYRRPGTNRFVALFAWEFPQYATAVEKWNELRATYSNVQALEEMFTRFLFFSYRNYVSNLTFLHPEKSMVVAVFCHAEACDDTALYELARTAFGRVE
jgi:hypothetical protein